MLTRPLALVAALALLTGCSLVSAQPDNKAALPSASLRVSQVMVVDETTPATDAAQIESTLMPTPAQVAVNSIQEAYRPAMLANGLPVLKVVVREASVKETKIEKQSTGWQRFLKVTPKTRYDARLVLEAQVTNSAGTQRPGNIISEATRQLETANLSEAERTRQLNKMVRMLVADGVAALDRQMTDRVGGLYQPTGGPGDFTVTPQPSGRWDKVRNWQ